MWIILVRGTPRRRSSGRFPVTEKAAAVCILGRGETASIFRRRSIFSAGGRAKGPGGTEFLFEDEKDFGGLNLYDETD